MEQRRHPWKVWLESCDRNEWGTDLKTNDWWCRGEEDDAERLTKELAELEERADKLSNTRSATLSSISYINERNRKRNVESAEAAILEEIRASGGQKAEDPFTRRSTKPRMAQLVNRYLAPSPTKMIKS